MKPWKWIKNHPAESMAIAMGLALTGGAAAGALGPAVGAAEAGSLAGASLAVGEEAAAIAAANAAAAGGAGSAALGGGEAISGLAGSHLAGGGAGAGLGTESALLAAYPAAEDFALQFAGQTIGGGGGGAGTQPALLSSYAAPSADPALLGGNTPLGSPYSGWLDKATARVGDKLKDPKTVMQLGLMAAQSGTPQRSQQSAMFEPAPAMRNALRSQEDITKEWLLRNDPKTYARIYGPPRPQGVA